MKRSHMMLLAIAVVVAAVVFLLFVFPGLRQHTVVFLDFDGGVLNEEIVRHRRAATPPIEPVRGQHVFLGWDTDFSEVTEDLVVRAMYEKKNYTVIFEDYDGSQLKVETVEYGTGAKPPSDPLAEGRQFLAWDVDYASVTQDIIVTAIYELDTYVVSFVDHDGTLLKEELVKHGHSATAPNVSDRGLEVFSGWSSDLSSITEDLTVVAAYGPRTYTVVFRDHDRTDLKVQQVEHGSNASPPDNPIREGYSFVGWSRYFLNVTSDLAIEALYEIKSYTVVFEDHEGNELKTEIVDYGSAATPPRAPARAGYEFIGWSASFSEVTEDTTIKAVYVSSM